MRFTCSVLRRALNGPKLAASVTAVTAIDLKNNCSCSTTRMIQLLQNIETCPFYPILAVQFSKALAQLDAVQQKIEISLGQNTKLLTETQSKFTENVAKILLNFDNIEHRLTAIKKWFTYKSFFPFKFSVVELFTTKTFFVKFYSNIHGSINKKSPFNNI